MEEIVRFERQKMTVNHDDCELLSNPRDCKDVK